MKKLPVGIQTFREIREGNHIYVDKTKRIHELITQGKTYFISRPRRFGKSLLISTLEEIFKGNRELFRGLYIDSTDYDWPEHPVIRIDFSTLAKDNPTALEQSLRNRLRQIAAEYKIEIDADKLILDYFRDLIRKLSEINRVAVLIDEYDAPIIRHILNQDIAVPNREFLKEFYTVIKGEDAYVKFILLTGVSKFSKVGVFSGLNNLLDITMDDQFGDLLGWTQQELETNFEDRISELSQKEKIGFEETTQKIKHWYDGYQFSEASLAVYNPFSCLLLFKQRTFKAHWFETGTPTFLIQLLRQSDQSALGEIVGTELAEDAFSAYEIEDLDVLPLLIQTGYLTIKSYDKEIRLYRLGYPNFEVSEAFNNRLIQSFSKVRSGLAGSYVVKLIRKLQTNDLEEFFEILKIFFANIPYDIQLKNEKYYQTVFFVLFTLIGLRTRAEVRTNRGRADAVIELDEAVYVFEFKLRGSKEEALAQIKSKKYHQKFLGLNKKVYLLGVEFDQEERNIGDWILERA